MIEPIFKLLKALNSDASPWQIAFAAALAMIIGLTPLWSLHNLIILFIACVVRVHFSTFLVFWAVFSAIAYLMDPWFHQLGLYWLTLPALESFWTSLYQIDFWQVAHFNHTVTLGSLVVAIISFVPTTVFFRLSINRYRADVLPWVNKLKVLQVLKGSRLFELYQRVGQ